MKSTPLSIVLLLLILGGSFALKLDHLDHAGVKPLDEVFHAIVARNFLKHPLTPTLVDQPFLPTDNRDWLVSNIWLHKPPMAMWQIAISYAILGVNTFALRFPSVILSTLAAWLTYLIARQFFDEIAALIAAGLQAFNPVILMIVHGYVFSDHVDIALLFWTEISIFFLVRAIRAGGKLDPFLCGVAQGFAFLSKTFPALIVTGVMCVAMILPMLGLVKKSDVRLTIRGVLLMLGSTALTALPWIIYTAIRFPTEFSVEYTGILNHLSENVENWAAPWDQVVFYYWISIFHVFYPAIIAATFVAIFRAKQQKNLGLWLILAWAFGVIVPNLLATSKPMTATLVGWPAGWILLGWMISRAVRKDCLALGVWLAAMLLAIVWFNSGSIPAGGQNWGTTLPFATIMFQHLYIFWQVLIALAIGIAVAFAMSLRSKDQSNDPNQQKEQKSDVRGSTLHIALVTLASIATLFLAVRWWPGNHPRGYAYVAWQVTTIDQESPDFRNLGKFASHMPQNAAILVDEEQRPEDKQSHLLENKLVEFATDRTCYRATPQTWSDLSMRLFQAGAMPYLLTPRSLPLPIVFVNQDPPMTLYAFPPQSTNAGTQPLR
jgi:4-amino-4-deoxy-L-arabinose transferase-like glycosyltransferase